MSLHVHAARYAPVVVVILGLVLGLYVAGVATLPGLAFLVAIFHLQRRVGGKIAGLRFDGAGGGRVRIDGPYSKPDIRAEAWINGFGLEDYAFGDLDGKIHSLSGVLAFEDVTFAYPGRAPLLEGFTLQIPAGHTVALVGSTGSGKTTLVRLLLLPVQL